MRIVDSYSKLLTSGSLEHAHPVFRGWDYTDAEIEIWFQRNSTPAMRATAELYLAEVHEIVRRVEIAFGGELPGELVLIPSMGEVDGFARYDQGHHTVMLGIDFPDADLNYLRALTAHELSHVYRDHSPEVWGFLGKPLHQVSREEYLEATTGLEHLVSEGLATLNSQAIFPEIPGHVHHFYEPSDFRWCQEHELEIEKSLQHCLSQPDPDPWQFYRSGLVASGAPSRTHYYWAAKKIGAWIQSRPGMTLLEAHRLATHEITAF